MVLRITIQQWVRDKMSSENVMEMRPKWSFWPDFLKFIVLQTLNRQVNIYTIYICDTRSAQILQK